MRPKNKLFRNQRSGYLLLGSVVALSIALSPYLFYIYEIFPSGPVWETSFFRYESLYFENVLTAAWTYLGKIVPLYLLLLWFLTCKHWWYHVILIPISMYLYQLIVVVYDDVYLRTDYIDINQLIYLAPFFIIILSIVYLIRVKIFDRIYGLDLSELEETEISVFSNISEKDRRDLKGFQEEDEYSGNQDALIEDYYRKL